MNNKPRGITSYNWMLANEMTPCSSCLWMDGEVVILCHNHILLRRKIETLPSDKEELFNTRTATLSNLSKGNPHE